MACEHNPRMIRPGTQRTRSCAATHLLRRIAALGGVSVLALAGGCVARTEGQPSARPESSVSTEQTSTSTSSTSSTSSRPTAVTPDPAIAAEAAEILANADVARFNERICPGTHDIAPVSSIGGDYAGTTPAGIDTYYLPMSGDSVVARLSVHPGEAELMIILGLDFNTYSWCAYSTQWCPIDFAGLPPFITAQDSDTPALDELERTILCGH